MKPRIDLITASRVDLTLTLTLTLTLILILILILQPIITWLEVSCMLAASRVSADHRYLGASLA